MASKTQWRIQIGTERRGYMNVSVWEPPSEIAAAELRRLGIRLTRLPGEYRVNYENAGDVTAQFADDLQQALAIGRAMAAARDPQPRRNRGVIYRHNRRGGKKRCGRFDGSRSRRTGRSKT